MICVLGQRPQILHSWRKSDQASALRLRTTTSGEGTSAPEARSSDKATEILTGRCPGIDFSTSCRISISGLTIKIPMGVLPIREGLEWLRDISTSEIMRGRAKPRLTFRQMKYLRPRRVRLSQPGKPEGIHRSSETLRPVR